MNYKTEDLAQYCTNMCKVRKTTPTNPYLLHEQKYIIKNK